MSWGMLYYRHQHSEGIMKEALFFIAGLVVGVYHKDVPYLNQINTQKIKLHINGLIEAVSEAQ